MKVRRDKVTAALAHIAQHPGCGVIDLMEPCEIDRAGAMAIWTYLDHNNLIECRLEPLVIQKRTTNRWHLYPKAEPI